jgi:hypothetical protein
LQLVVFMISIVLALLWLGLQYQPADGPAELESFATCVEGADRETKLSEQQALSLCAGASSDGPLDCFLAADRALNLSDKQSMDLCRYADSTQPVECFTAADDDTFLSDQQILESCAPAPPAA